MAQLVAKGKLKVGDTYVHESIIGSTFIGRVEEETKVGSINGIIPSIEGWQKLSGITTLLLTIMKIRMRTDFRFKQVK